MSSITSMFVSVEDVAVWMRQQAEMSESSAKGTKVLKEKHKHLTRARTWVDAAEILEESWIDEIDGDRKTAKLRGRKLRS